MIFKCRMTLITYLTFKVNEHIRIKRSFVPFLLDIPFFWKNGLAEGVLISLAFFSL